MLDIGWSEFLIIAIVALLVIGPKDLPNALRTAGRWVRSARKVAGDFQRQVDDMMREAELDDVKKGLQSAQSFTARGQIERMLDPKGDVRSALDTTKIKSALSVDGPPIQKRTSAPTPAVPGTPRAANGASNGVAAPAAPPAPAVQAPATAPAASAVPNKGAPPPPAAAEPPAVPPKPAPVAGPASSDGNPA